MRFPLVAARWVRHLAPRRLVFAVFVGAILVVFVVVGDLLGEARVAAMARASNDAANLSSLIARDLGGNIHLLDLAMTNAVAGFNDPAVMAAPPALRQRLLFDLARTTEGLGAILILDTKGNVVADSIAVAPVGLNFGDRAAFRVHVDDPGRGLYVGVPVISRIDGSKVLALSRRVSGPDGTFKGVVLATIRLNDLDNRLADLRLDPHTTISLLRMEGKIGTIIARLPYDARSVGLTMPRPHLLRRLQAASEGEYVATSVIDDVDRLWHYQAMVGNALVLSVGLSIADIYAEWWRKTIMVAAILLVFFAVIIVLAWGLKRELDRRGAAEAALRTVSLQDALTGIANRRHFDETLATAWRQAIERGTSVSILLIDADNFKLFNDTYGHVAGDAALKALGSVLRATMDRPGALAARYGGEEFAVILPATDRQCAVAIAETLRRDVLALAIPFLHAPGGLFTISIGVARMTPVAGDRPDDLMTRADAALYASKRGGRDRVSTHDDPRFDAAA